MSKNLFKLDAGESVFFKRQLEYVKSRTYDTKYKELKAFMLFPISNEAPSGAREITYRKFSGVGIAKIVSDYANDFPRVDTFGEEVTQKIKSIGASYGYSIQEIRESQMAGARLDQRRSDLTKRVINQKINNIAFNGDSNYNLQGFIDYPGITEYTVLADGTGSSKLWVNKTPDQIVRDALGLVSAVSTTTNGIESPTTLLLPLDNYLYIAGTRMGDGDSMTILKFILENNPFIKEIQWVVELNSAGAGSTGRMMCYNKSDTHLTLEIPQPYEQFPAQQKGMEFEIPCHARTAGMIVYYPLSVAFGDGI